MSRIPHLDSYEQYEDLFDSMQEDRQARRKRKVKANHRPKKAETEVVAALAAEGDVSTAPTMSYQPSRFEAQWLGDSLRPFFDRGVITDVLALVRGGKEASVYVCEAHPVLGVPLVAAKVYRPRMFRQMRNDAVYREGRQILTESGKVVKETDHRVMRAIGKKSAFGQEVAGTSWLMYEHNTLKMLHGAGLDVPTPYTSATNALLMEYFGDVHSPAPTLSLIELDEDEAEPLFNRVMRNIEVMLARGIIHGDLSAYNILYWEGKITIIDFPQVTNPTGNPNAFDIFERDVHRVCEYFADQGVHSNPDAIVNRLWKTHVKLDV